MIAIESVVLLHTIVIHTMYGAFVFQHRNKIHKVIIQHDGIKGKIYQAILFF